MIIYIYMTILEIITYKILYIYSTFNPIFQ